MKTTLNVTGMTCAMCAKHVGEAIESVEGVTNVEVDLASGVATFELGSGSMEKIIEAIEEEGYEAVEA